MLFKADDVSAELARNSCVAELLFGFQVAMGAVVKPCQWRQEITVKRQLMFDMSDILQYSLAAMV